MSAVCLYFHLSNFIFTFLLMGAAPAKIWLEPFSYMIFGQFLSHVAHSRHNYTGNTGVYVRELPK